MQQFSFAHNIFADGDPFLKGFLGLSLFPSAEARRNASNYEAVVIYILVHQYAEFVGSRVMMAIGKHRDRKVTIRPRPILDPDPKVPETEFSRLYNASAGATDPRDARSAGEGSDVAIMYNPGVYADAMGLAPDTTAGLSDSILLHELVHAMSEVSGVLADQMGAPTGYDNLEEFTAVVVANVSRSENGQGYPKLREGHGFGTLPVLLTGSQAFYNRYSSYMEQICANHPWLAKELKQATGISHNPFVYCTSV